MYQIVLEIQPKLKALFLVSLFGLISISCSVPDFSHIDAGDMQQQISGEPLLRVHAFPFYDDEKQEFFVRVRAFVLHNSLIYTKKDGRSAAAFELDGTVYTQQEEEAPRQFSTSDSVYYVNNKEIEAGFESIYVFSIPASQGAHTISVRLTDKTSGISKELTEEIYLPQTKTNAGILWSELATSDGGNSKERQVFSSYVIPDNVDPLTARFQVITQKPTSVSVELLRFRSDSSIARPPQYNTPSKGSLIYKGIDYTQADTLLAKKFRISPDSSSVMEISLPSISIHGNYRLSLELMEPEVRENKQSRDFSIRNQRYPNIRSLDEMVKALRYIAYPDEYSMLRSKTPDSLLHDAFDGFWIDLYGNKQKAQNMLSTYVSRLEEANQLFPSYKEGWKTDMGMIYVLFGRPILTENRIDGVVWAYERYQYEPNRVFYFERVRNPYSFFPFTHYILQRDGIYQQVYIEQRGKWRNGNLN